jgi:hypothetical protein
MPRAMCCYQTSMLLLTSEMDLKENNSTTERKDGCEETAWLPMD